MHFHRFVEHACRRREFQGLDLLQMRDSDQQSDHFNRTSRSLLHALWIKESEDDQSECIQVFVAYTVVQGTRG